ncbi:hypothetical protein ALC57_02064, partial [Trachymyrmex cornetzi]
YINVKQDFSKNLGEIVRLFIARVVAIKFTAVKKVKDKEILKDTNFYKLIEGQFLSVHKESINSRQFGQLMGKVLNNAKDWDGFRFIRQGTKGNNNQEKDENKVSENEEDSEKSEEDSDESQ